MRYRLLFCMGLALFCACQKQEFDLPGNDDYGIPSSGEKKEIIISATLADTAPETRTELERVVVNGVTTNHIYWLPGDQIAIFSAGEESVFTSQNTERALKAFFKGQISVISGGEGEETSYTWGIYPYRDNLEYREPNGNSSTAQILTYVPTIQSGKAGSFADDLAITLGRSKSLEYTFKSAYSGLMLMFKSNDIVSATLKGNNNESLAGKFWIGMDSSLAPEVKEVVEGQREITLYAPDGKTFETEKYYYFITMPGVRVPQGYSVTVRKKDGTEGTYSLNADRTFARNNFLGISGYVDQRVSSWHASTTQGPNEIWYTTTDGEAATYNADTSVSGNEVDEIIAPNDNDGVGIIRFKAPLSMIDARAMFNNGNLTTVSLPEAVETIAANAFTSTNLEQITLPKNLKTIGRSAFSRTKLETIVLPSGLQTIRAGAFDSCTSLESITLPESVQTLEFSLFGNCTSLREFRGKFASADGRCLIVEEDGVKTLGAFASKGMEGMTYSVPADVQRIAMSAFMYASLSHIVLPEGLKSIESQAFLSSELVDVTIPSTVQSIGNIAFAYCRNLQSIKILRSDDVIQATGTGIFDAASGTTGCPIYVPSGLLGYYKVYRYWENYAARYEALQDKSEIWYTTADNEPLSFSDHNTVGGISFDHTFSNGKGVLKCTDQGATWTEVPEGLFRNKYFVATVSLPESVTTINKNAFQSCYRLTAAEIGTQVTYIGESAFTGCSALNDVVLPPNLKTLGRHAFYGCTSLTSINIPDELENIGYPETDSTPFSNCTSLAFFSGNKNLVSDDGRLLVKDGALISSALSGLSVYSVPTTVTTINSNAMSGSEITRVHLPNTVTSIGWAAFSGSKLKQISIPASVTKINYLAFTRCSDLVEVDMESVNPPTIYDDSFSDTNETFQIAIPGAGYVNYTSESNPNWYALRDHFVFYQDNNEIWYHLVGGEATWLPVGGNADFGANLLGSKRVTIPIGDDPYIVRPQVRFPSDLSVNNSVIIVYPFDNTVTKVPANAFSSSDWNNKLDWISLPQLVTEIGAAAFKDDAKLLDFPIYGYYNLTKIDDDAFNGCSKMKYNYSGQETIQASRTTTIGDRAFQGCSSIVRFYAHNVTSLGEAAFSNCTNLINAIIGPVTELKNDTFNGCSNLERVDLTRPETLVSIGNNVFRNCATLVKVGGQGIENSVTLPALQSTGSYAFCGTGIVSVDLPELLSLGNSAAGNSGNNGHVFSNNYYLSSVNIPKLKYCYGWYNFQNCYSLESIYLPAIERMDDFTFGYCRNLKSIKFGQNLNRVSAYIFSNITSTIDRTLTFEGRTPPGEFSSDAFYVDYTNRSKLFGVDYGSISVIVPQGTLVAYKTAFRTVNTAYEAYWNVMMEAN